MAAVEEQKKEKQGVRQGQGPLDGLLADSLIIKADCENAIKHRHAADHRVKHVLHYLADLEIVD